MSYNDRDYLPRERYESHDRMQTTPSLSSTGDSPSFPLTFPEFDHNLGVGPSTFSSQVQFQMPQFILGGPPAVPPGGGAEAMTSMLPTPGSMHANTWFVNDFLKYGRSPLTPSAPAVAPSTTSLYRSNPGSDEGRYFDLSTARSPANISLNSPMQSPTIFRPNPPQEVKLPSAFPPLNSPGFNPTISLDANKMGIPSNVQPLLYSASGFDVLSILAKVATRPKPKIVLGPVDFTCSFCFVDVRRFDCPIVYASPSFFQLTGYDEHEVLGRNCRFLQSPDGNTGKGTERKFTSPDAVQHLKKCLSAHKECQTSLINYRKGGQAFINLATIIPIPADDSDEIAYHVGFQVDLTEQPSAILQRLNDGSYIVNYSASSSSPHSGQSRDRHRAVSKDLRNIISNGNPTAVPKNEQDNTELNAFLLQNMDDFVHVLSLKGLFQYVSPSVRNVLEYTAEELMGKSISDICHPADITPVIRELKESSATLTLPLDAPPGTQPPLKTVSLLFRARTKRSGYVWIESHGRLHVEPGKGRKSIILCGRLRAMPRLDWRTVTHAGGMLENEFWGLLSQHGHWLNVSAQASPILNKPLSQITGSSILEMIPQARHQNHVLHALQEASGRLRTSSFFEAIVELQMEKGQAPRAAKMIFFATEDDGGLGASPLASTSSLNLSAPVVCQVKMLPHHVAGGSADSTQRSPMLTPVPAHCLPSLGNLFDELDTTRHTSWQYELTHLKIANKNLMSSIAQLEAEQGLPLTVFTQSSAQTGTASESSPIRPRKRARDDDNNEQSRGEDVG